MLKMVHFTLESPWWDRVTICVHTGYCSFKVANTNKIGLWFCRTFQKCTTLTESSRPDLAAICTLPADHFLQHLSSLTLRWIESPGWWWPVPCGETHSDGRVQVFCWTWGSAVERCLGQLQQPTHQIRTRIWILVHILLADLAPWPEHSWWQCCTNFQWLANRQVLWREIMY